MGEKIIQPPFYNSGFYNGRFYEGGGFYNDGAGGGDLRECIFLTYFENFDDGTKQDVPKIGDPYTILLNGTHQVYEKSLIADLYGGVTALYNYATTQDNSDAARIKTLDLSNYDIFSLELWFLNTGTRSDYQTHIHILQHMIFDPGFSQTEFRISGPYAANAQKPNYTLYNGTNWSYYNGNFIKLGEPTRFVKTFVSLVADRNNNEIRLYANGKIMYKVSNFNIPDNVIFRANNQNTEKQTYVTGMAAFTYDKSDNEGMTYPVPQEKYL